MPRQTALPPTLRPRLVDREAAAAYVNLSATTFDQAVVAGHMPRARLFPGTRRKAWDVLQLDRFVDALPIDGEAGESLEPGPEVVL